MSRTTARKPGSRVYPASDTVPLISLAATSAAINNNQGNPSSLEDGVDVIQVDVFDETRLPSRSNMAVPLGIVLLVMIVNCYIGTSMWWYSNGQDPELAYAFMWSEFGVSAVLAGYLMYLRYYGYPRVPGAGLERIAVYSDLHYFWATLCVIIVLTVSSLTIMYFGAWRIAFASVDGFLDKLDKISDLSTQTAKMHSDYLMLQMFHALGTVLYATVFYGAVHREYNSIFSRPVDAILKAQTVEDKRRAIASARALSTTSVLR